MSSVTWTITSMKVQTYKLSWCVFTIILIMFYLTGMEVASYLLDKASSITVIGSSELPYQNTLGREVGRITMMVTAVTVYIRLLFLFTSRSFCLPIIPSVSADAVRVQHQILHEWHCDRNQRRERQGEEECFTRILYYNLRFKLSEKGETKLCWCLIHQQVKEVVLKSGKVIPTDVLIVGIGEINSFTLLHTFLF